MLAQAGNWPQWRGPNNNGSAAETGLPDSCDPAKAKWMTPMPGASHATPIVWGERVFVTSTDPASNGLLGMCVSARDGKILWQKRLGDNIKAPRNNGATPSPVTDGKLVCFLFGSGDLAALDMDGNLLWTKNLVSQHGNLCTQFGYSSSPLLWDGKLFIQILRRTKPYSGPAGTEQPLDSLILAFDFLTGRELWKHVRPSAALNESLESYSTPVPFEFQNRKELLVQGGDCISGHDPATGSELWRVEYNPQRETHWRLIPSPVTAGRRIMMATPRGGPLLALDAGATGKQTGRCQIAQDGAWRASPTGANGKIYVMSEQGEVVVVSAGPNGQILSRTDLADGPACATISAANQCLFIRTAGKLTCFGK